MKERNQSLID